MKTKLLLLLLFFTGTGIIAQNVAINATGAAPAASAMLDVSSTSMGLLIPRMTTAQRVAIASPATGLVVYDTSTSQFWYYTGSMWVPILANAASGTGGWDLVGNAGTTAGTNFIGTTDAVDFVFKTSATERMRLLSTGNFGIGTAAPAYRFTATNAVAASYTGASLNTDANGYGFTGQNTAASGAGGGIGVVALSSQSVGFGLYAGNNNASGTGVIAYGNNGAASYLGTGSGGAFSGVTGVAGFSNSATGMGIDGRNSNGTGTGIIGTGNAIAGSYLVNGSGGAFKGTLDGAFIYNTSAGTSEAIYTNNGGVICRVNYYNGATFTQYKILGTGTVSCIIPDANGTQRVMHCPEAPEVYYTDYGQGQLVNGHAHITIDSTLARNIVINEQHPLRAYVQLEGDCNGVYITNKTATGFDVVELHGGTSNVSFQWNIVCNAGDLNLPNGKHASYADLRLEPAPADKPMTDLPAAVPAKKPEPALANSGNK